MFDLFPAMDVVAATKVSDFAAFLSIVSVCAGALYLVYRHVAPDEPEEREFAATIFILTIAIGLLVSIIKHAPAISFGLFGAMSIVRFRSQIKRPQRMIFIFMAAAIGVCCGAGEYLTTVMGTVVLSALTIVAFKFTPVQVKSKSKREGKSATGGPVPASTVATASALSATAHPPSPANWGLDFLTASLGDGRRVRILAIVDEATREALATIPETSFSDARVIGELDRLVAERGKPQAVLSESWPQLATRMAVEWRQAAGIEWLSLEQSSNSSAFIVEYADSLRDRCFRGDGLANLVEARASLENWRQRYNMETAAGEAARLERVAGHPGPRLAVASARETADPPAPMAIENEPFIQRSISV